MRGLILICFLALTACSTTPEPACSFLPELLIPEEPLDQTKSLKAPLPQKEQVSLYLQDLGSLELLRARHNELVAQARDCAQLQTARKTHWPL